MDIFIENAVSSDASALLTYFKKIGEETDNLSFGAEGLPFSCEEEAAYILSMEGSQDDALFLAKIDGKIIGEASIHRLPRRMCHRGEFSISVLKEYWDMGVGSILLEKIITFARNNHFEVIDLQVRSDNARAIHLYQKHGFLKIGTHESFLKIHKTPIPFDYMTLHL